MRSNEKGIILIMVLLALLAMAIFLPALVFVVQNETKWSVKQKKTTTAFHMAEQGLDRGIWKLQEADDVWNAVSTGTQLAGYNFDAIYKSTDLAGGVEGEYKIRLTTTSTPNTVAVQSMGRDRSTDEIRAIEAIYSKVAINAGLQARGGLEYKPGLVVHWGPVVNFTNITQSPSQYYPRKISKGYITGRDTDPNSPNGHDFYSPWPQPATYDYNSYQSKLGNPPTIDLEAFKQIAKNSSVPKLGQQPNGNSVAYSTPTGSGYYEDDVTITTVGGGDYIFTCSTCVIYIAKTAAGAKGDAKFVNNSLSFLRVRALIVEDDFDMNGNNSLPNRNAPIPVGAEKEYAHPTAQTYWDANFDAIGEGGSYSVPDARVWGYVYVGDDLGNSGGSDPVIIGTLDIAGTMSANNTVIYFDSSVSTGVLALNIKPQLQYWREVKADW